MNSLRLGQTHPRSFIDFIDIDHYFPSPATFGATAKDNTAAQKEKSWFSFFESLCYNRGLSISNAVSWIATPFEAF
jgi:hypothetical protein